jgi:hypothetical protein
MGSNMLKDKNLSFVIGAVKLSQYLFKKHSDFLLSKNSSGSGTGIGESNNAESKKDVIQKITLGLKEAGKTSSLPGLLFYFNIPEEKHQQSFVTEFNKLTKYSDASIKTTKQRVVA